MAEATGAAASGARKNVATVRCGVYGQPGPYAGKTIAQVRKELGTQLQIPSDAKAYKGKKVMEEDYVIQPDDDIQFHRLSGEKGKGF